MSKRPSLIGDLQLPPQAPDPVPGDRPADRPSGPVGRRVRPEVVHTSVYLPKAVHQRLREIAFTTDRKIHDIMMEGIDAALRRYGHPSVAELRRRGETR